MSYGTSILSDDTSVTSDAKSVMSDGMIRSMGIRFESLSSVFHSCFLEYFSFRPFCEGSLSFLFSFPFYPFSHSTPFHIPLLFPFRFYFIRVPILFSFLFFIPSRLLRACVHSGSDNHNR